MSELKRKAMVIGTALVIMPSMAFIGLFPGVIVGMVAVGDSSDYFVTWILGIAAVFGIAGIFVGRNEANKQYRKMLGKQQGGQAGSPK